MNIEEIEEQLKVTRDALDKLASEQHKQETELGALKLEPDQTIYLDKLHAVIDSLKLVPLGDADAVTIRVYKHKQAKDGSTSFDCPNGWYNREPVYATDCIDDIVTTRSFSKKWGDR